MSAPPSPCGDADSLSARGDWGLIVVVIAMMAARVAVGGALHLTEDEAYYRLWAQAPALGYFDHPPMIAWWIWAGVHIAGDTPLGVRLLPILASALTTALVWDLARLAGGTPAQARRAGVWFNAMLLVAAGGFLAVPDAPASLFWTLCLWCLFRARRHAGFGWWLAAGLAAGLACLSKYSALFLGPGVLLWLIASREGRASLSRPGPWLALMVAAAVFGLNVGWNATHHWLTFAKQFGRIAPRGWAPRHLLEFVGGQLLLMNPLVAMLVGRAIVDRRAAAAAGPLLLTGLPFVAYLAVHSLHDRIEAHWPAPIYPTLAVCAALGPAAGGRLWAALRRAVPVVGFGAPLLAAAIIAMPTGVLRLRHDPAESVRGWPPFAARVEALRRQAGAGWVGTASYGVAAQLADAPQIAAPILQISERRRWLGLKTGAGADLSRPGLLVDLARRIDLPALGRCFREVRPLGEIDRGRTPYQAVFLAGPVVDVVGAGCAREP